MVLIRRQKRVAGNSHTFRRVSPGRIVVVFFRKKKQQQICRILKFSRSLLEKAKASEALSLFLLAAKKNAIIVRVISVGKLS